MFSATTRTTKMKIAVPRIAPMILFHSKESMALPMPGRVPANTGRHYPPGLARHCAEASHKLQAVSGFSANPGLHRRTQEPRMNPILLIPARMASSRLPDKPLAPIGGVPMIVRVWARAVAAGLGPVVVAAGESEI